MTGHKRKKRKVELPVSPKVEVQKNKLLVKWGVASNSSSDEAQQVQGRKTRSMSSHSGESGTVKTSEKV